MDHLPIFLNLKNARALVVGNGTIAARKADLLLRAGCGLTVIAPELGEELGVLAETYSFEHKTGDLSADDLDGCVVVFGCCQDDGESCSVYDFYLEKKAQWELMSDAQKKFIDIFHNSKTFPQDNVSCNPNLPSSSQAYEVMVF